MNVPPTAEPDDEAPVVRMQAPVLILPGLLPAELCARLIAFWEAGEKSDGVVASTGTGALAVNRGSKRRADVFIPDGHALVGDIATAVSGRVGPEVLKAFQFRIEVMEGLRIGCYDAAEGGFFRAHHDNTTPATQHRRFAMTVNLNTGEYEGGGLRFPEYGPQLYCPDAGGAAVFSCSLLHEVLPVTRGRRFGLFSFFTTAADEEMRRARAAGSPPSPGDARGMA